MDIQNRFSVSGNIVDVVKLRIYKGTITVEDGKITSIREGNVTEDHFLLPGFVDAHIHIESSMLIPSEFARIAVTHGTVATVSDPHEIANVLGVDGVNFMIENGKKVPFKFYFGAPSCVPATAFETSGSNIDAVETEKLLKSPDICYLAEMMNFPGVLYEDPEVMKKLAAARKFNKPVDGHAPSLAGDNLRKYINSGISTDHECFIMQEAIEKIKNGMKIQIREGSAAKNFDDLIGLIEEFSESVMFCSDDKHPDDLVEGHINLLVKRAIEKGYDPLKVLRIVSFNPVKHYNLDVGLLQEGNKADLIIVNNLKDLVVLKTFINGNMVAENGNSKIDRVVEKPVNVFEAIAVEEKDITVKTEGEKIKIIKAMERQLITGSLIAEARVESGFVVNNTDQDIIKIVVLNRYCNSRPAVGFINNFNMKKGAIASTVAHDSHNIIAVGATDRDIVRAINLLVESKGGISLVNSTEEIILPLPVGGLMSCEDGYEIAVKYKHINDRVKATGTRLKSPYMTLSFMALLVIPELKLSDKGLFDGIKFEMTSLFC
jgi:adenine deaminase